MATKTPPKSPPKKQPTKMLGANGFKYQQQYGVIVMCNDEPHHQTIFEALRSLGLKCKVVAV